jgi:hypothetical protein
MLSVFVGGKFVLRMDCRCFRVFVTLRHMSHVFLLLCEKVVRYESKKVKSCLE